MLRHHGAIVVVTGQFVHCPPGPPGCGVAVTVTTRGGRGRAGADSPQTVTVATATFRIAAGARRVISFRLTRTGVILLQRLQRLPIRAVAIGTHGAAKPVRIVMILTLIEPGRPHRHSTGGASPHPGHHHRHHHRGP